MKVEIDPITHQEIDAAVGEAFDKFVDTINRDGVDFDAMDIQDIAELFFANGFYRGCMAMTDNEDLQETIHMMAEETNYQLKQ